MKKGEVVFEIDEHRVVDPRSNSCQLVAMRSFMGYNKCEIARTCHMG